MLRWCADICNPPERPHGRPRPEIRALVKPVRRLDDVLEPPDSLEYFCDSLQMEPGPPGMEPPAALVSKHFCENAARLLIIVPAPGTPLACGFDPRLNSSDSRKGDAGDLLRWAEANQFATLLFSAQALESSPDVWDRVLRSSPAHYVAVAVAQGALPLVCGALEKLHPLLYTRVRTIFVLWDDVKGAMGAPPSYPEDLVTHMKGSLMQLPAEWSSLDAFAMFQCWFQLLLRQEDFWMEQEMRKYMGLSSLKENDVPGLRRVPVDDRVSRLDRNRDTDELSRLLQTTVENGNEEEPGVD